MYDGIIESESLHHPELIEGLNVDTTQIVHPEESTLHDSWHLHLFHVAEHALPETLERISIDLKEGWYSVLFDQRIYYILFAHRIFALPIELSTTSHAYIEAQQYGQSHGVQAIYTDFFTNLTGYQRIIESVNREAALLATSLHPPMIALISEETFGRPSHPDTWHSHQERRAARAVLIDDQDHVALMYVRELDYYKLPGGGIDEGEEPIETLKRELREEVGSQQIDIVHELGVVQEFREARAFTGFHYAYIARQHGVPDAPQRTPDEIADGYETVWAPSLEEAIKLVTSGRPPSYNAAFEKARELAILRAARDYLG